MGSVFFLLSLIFYNVVITIQLLKLKHVFKLKRAFIRCLMEARQCVRS